jgi:hypothetical protein
MICSKCSLNEAVGHAWCKLCRKAYDAARFQEKRELRESQIKAQQQRVKEWMDDIKSKTPCADCKLKWPPYVMQWDHLPGSVKVANVSDLARRGAKTAAMTEMKKCELVCGNCHAIRTNNRRQDMV